MSTTPKPPPGSANSSPKATSLRVMSIPATSSSSSQLTLWDTPSATSSPASAAGPSPSISPTSPPPHPSGPAPALASPSQSQARAEGRRTRVTFGRTSAVSSASAALQSSLASKLHRRLAASGSPEYVLTWKHWPIAQQQPICALRAAARTAKSGYCVAIRPLHGNPPPSPPPTSASASGGALAGWRSPDHNQRGGSYADPDKALARLASGHQINLEDQAVLAGWPTPNTPSGGRSMDPEKMSSTGMTLDGKKHTVSLEHVARFAELPDPPPTPPGPPSTSSPAATPKRGALNPALSRWLMGYPAAWDSCGATAMQSSRKERPTSSPPPSKPSKKRSATVPVAPASEI